MSAIWRLPETNLNKTKRQFLFTIEKHTIPIN